MKNKLTQLPEGELELMQCLWDAGGPVERRSFDSAFRASRNWADSTILTMLARLEKKGFVRISKDGNRNLYTPAVSRQQYLDYVNNSFVSRLYHNSFTGMVAAMAASRKVSEQELDELSSLIEKLKGEDGK